ncbi:unnamed protein product, partial [Ectocarpus fasciculatus]
KDYFRVLRERPEYRVLFIAYCIDNAGNWLSFIACLSIIDRYGKASYTSLYFIFRLLPSVCLAGVLGPLADRLNKRDGMILCNVGSALAVLVIALPWPEHVLLPIVLGAALVQFSFDTLYSPLRQSMIPYFVKDADMQVVTTLDSVAWSTVGALGATLGGAICNAFGNRVGFVTDFCSFLIVAGLTMTLPRNYEALNIRDKVKITAPGQAGNEVLEKAAGSSSQMVIAMFRYLMSHPKVMIVCCAKACGALVWSAADLLQVRFSAMSSMGALGGAQLTLGVLYSMVGVGCYVGPMSWNTCTPQNGRVLFSRIVISFSNLFIAYLITVFAPNILVLMLATIIRACGAGTLWTYSTLLVQIWCPAEMKGRIFAFENYLHNLISIVTFFFCAVLFDYWQFNELQISLIMCFLGMSVFLAWGAFY